MSITVARGRHVRDLVQTLSEARRQKVNAAICNPCFELWLLLHREDENDCDRFADCADVESALRQTPGGYNKSRLQPQQFTRRSVADACARARRLDRSEPWSIPEGSSAQVYRLVEAIVAGTVVHRRPPEFRHVMR